MIVDDSTIGDWFLFYWRLMLLWSMGVAFESTCSFRDVNGLPRLFQYFVVFVPCVTQENEDAGSIQGYILLLFL